MNFPWSSPPDGHESIPPQPSPSQLPASNRPDTKETAGAILVVEDDRASRNALRLLLANYGWKVQTASTLAEGLSSLKSSPPDALILDLMLPDGNGVNLLETLSRSRPDLRVVVTTGVSDETWLAAVRSYPSVTLLRKPVNLIELLKHL